MSLSLPTLSGLQDALIRIRPFLPETPLVRSELLSRALQAEVWLKNETVSPIASFKLRGALTALLRAGRSGSSQVVTSSTGNHGQGIASAARLLGLQAHVFLPSRPNPLKRSRIQAFGAKIAVSFSVELARRPGRVGCWASLQGLVAGDDFFRAWSPLASPPPSPSEAGWQALCFAFQRCSTLTFGWSGYIFEAGFLQILWVFTGS